MTPIRTLTLLAAVAVPLSAADTYAIDASHSSAQFKVQHLGVSNTYGRFTKIDGVVTWDASDAAKAVTVTIKTESIDTAVEKRDQHLRGPDFFDVKQFPDLTFVSKSWKAVEPAGTFEVSGDITLKGVTKPLTVKVVKIGEGKDPWGGFRVGFETVFDLSRKDFGVSYMPDGIGDKVSVTFGIEAVRK
ncbi:hypothetical protein LBMAG53_10590 [Planctomycetota bacterium]|nr:hypothetical protein LBMAG53_10590 [Planctomycetota bacterium]